MLNKIALVVLKSARLNKKPNFCLIDGENILNDKHNSLGYLEPLRLQKGKFIQTCIRLGNSVACSNKLPEKKSLKSQAHRYKTAEHSADLLT